MKPVMFAILFAGSTWFSCGEENQSLPPDKVPTEVQAALAKAFLNPLDLD